MARARRLVREENQVRKTDWDETAFIQYLQQSCNPVSVRERLSCAKKYGHILDTGDAREILALDREQRNRVMKAIALLAKHQGRYDQWRAIRQKHDIRWGSEPAEAVFNRIIGSTEASYTEMLQWIKSTIKILPPSYGNILVFNTLTGLRASEALASIRLIKTDLDNYMNDGLLQHIHYPHLFLRRTKKAFISIVIPNLIETADNCQDVNYEGFQGYFKRRSYSANLKYCRRVFATHLRLKGIDHEIIDLLQGRVSRQVFTRHYYRPDMKKEFAKVSEILEGLKQELIDS